MEDAVNSVETDWAKLRDKYLLLLSTQTPPQTAWLQLNAEIGIAITYGLAVLHDRIDDLEPAAETAKIIKLLEQIAQNTAPD